MQANSSKALFVESEKLILKFVKKFKMPGIQKQS